MYIRVENLRARSGFDDRQYWVWYVVYCWCLFVKSNTLSVGARMIFNACGMFLKLGFRTVWYQMSSTFLEFYCVAARHLWDLFITKEQPRYSFRLDEGVLVKDLSWKCRERSFFFLLRPAINGIILWDKITRIFLTIWNLSLRLLLTLEGTFPKIFRTRVIFNEIIYHCKANKLGSENTNYVFFFRSGKRARAFKRKTDGVCFTKLPASVFARTSKQTGPCHSRFYGLTKSVRFFRYFHCFPSKSTLKLPGQ